MLLVDAKTVGVNLDREPLTLWLVHRQKKQANSSSIPFAPSITALLLSRTRSSSGCIALGQRVKTVELHPLLSHHIEVLRADDFVFFKINISPT